MLFPKPDIFKTTIIVLLMTATSHLAFGAAGDGSPGDTNIKYFGRWDRSNASAFHGYWGGAYLKTIFTGTTIKVNLGNTLKYHVKIDDKPWVTFVAVNGTNNLAPTPLAQGTHTLIIAQGQDYSYDFAFKGISLDPGATTSTPSVRADLIEWIGDSITDGYTDTRSDVSDYAWICAESLNSEHTQIAFPGIALVDGYGVNNNKTGMGTQYFKLQDLNYGASVNWDFSNYTAKIVVVNIGTNDGNTPNDLYQSTYIAFLGNIRTKFPAAHIVVLVPNGGAHRAQDSAAYQARVAAGDKNVHYINTTGWLKGVEMNDGAHPSDSGHVKLASLLKPLLYGYLTPAAPVITPDKGNNRRIASSAVVPANNLQMEILRLDGSVVEHRTKWRTGISSLPTGIYLVRTFNENGTVRNNRVSLLQHKGSGNGVFPVCCPDDVAAP